MNSAAHHMQKSFDFEPPRLAKSSREALIEIMRQKGPCRSIALVCEPGLPDDAYEVFNELVTEGVIHVVGQHRYQGVVPAWHIENIYALKQEEIAAK